MARTPDPGVTPGTVLRPKAELGVVDRGDRIAMVDLDRLAAPPIILEGTAAEIWRRLDGTTPLGAIAKELAAAYEADPDDVLSDVLSFAGFLAAGGVTEPL